MALHPGSYGQFGGESEGSLDKDIRDAQNEVSRLENMGISGLALINAKKKLQDAKNKQQAATGSQQGLSQSIAQEATSFTGGYTPTGLTPGLRALTAGLNTDPIQGFVPVPGLGSARVTTPGASARPIAGFTPVGGEAANVRYGEDQVVARGQQALSSEFVPSAYRALGQISPETVQRLNSINFEGEGRLNAEVREAQNEVSRVSGRPDSLSRRYADFRLQEVERNLQSATGSQRGTARIRPENRGGGRLVGGRSTYRRAGPRPRPRVGGRSRRSSFRSRPRSTRRFAGRYGGR